MQIESFAGDCSCDVNIAKTAFPFILPCVKFQCEDPGQWGAREGVMTDSQTEWQTERQINILTDRQTDMYTDRQTYWQTNKKTREAWLNLNSIKFILSRKKDKRRIKSSLSMQINTRRTTGIQVIDVGDKGNGRSPLLPPSFYIVPEKLYI